MSLFHSSVASITASLQTMVAKLEAHAAEMTLRCLKHQALADAASEEAVQAARVRSKLASILD